MPTLADLSRTITEHLTAHPEDALEVLGAVERATPPSAEAREVLHCRCDCVPDLGPAHCHLCSTERGEQVAWPDCSVVGPDLSRVDRVTVVGPEGSLFERSGIYDHGVELAVQDDGRTLKILPAI